MAEFDAGAALGGALSMTGGIIAADMNADDAKWLAKYNAQANGILAAESRDWSSVESAKAYARQVALYDRQFSDALGADADKYRRAVSGLRAAGLNPLLAVQGLSPTGVSSSAPGVNMAQSAHGSASTPSGMNRGSGIQSAFEGAGKIANAMVGLDLQKKQAETEQAQKAVESTASDVELKKSQTAKNKIETATKTAELGEAADNARYPNSLLKSVRSFWDDIIKSGKIEDTVNSAKDIGTIGYQMFQDHAHDLDVHSAKQGKKVDKAVHDAIQVLVPDKSTPSQRGARQLNNVRKGSRNMFDSLYGGYD